MKIIRIRTVNCDRIIIKMNNSMYSFKIVSSQSFLYDSII